MVKVFKRFLKSLIICAALVALWQGCISFFEIPPFIFSSPLEVFTYVEANFTLLAANTLTTTFEAIAGLVLGSLAAIALGALSLYNPWLTKSFYRLIFVVQIVPLVAIAPILIMWVGFGIYAKILIVFLVCVFPAAVNFVSGLTSSNQELIHFLQSAKATRWSIFKWVYLPQGCTSIFSGLKIAVTYSFGAATVAEFLGAEKGIGIVITRAISSFNTPALCASILIIVFTTLVLYRMVAYLEWLLTPWKRGSTPKET